MIGCGRCSLRVSQVGGLWLDRVWQALTESITDKRRLWYDGVWQVLVEGITGNGRFKLGTVFVSSQRTFFQG